MQNLTKPVINPVTKRPEPVMNASYLAGALITLVKLAIALAISLGVMDLDDNQQTLIVTIVAIAVDIGIVSGSMWFGARSRTTPTSDPRDDQGRKLTPEGQ